MEDAYIVDAARSPIGKFLGSLSALPATRLGAAVAKGLVSRSGIAAKDICEVIVGNVLSAGLGQNPAKQVVMYSGIPETTPAFNVNKVCASGLKAVALGAEAIWCGNGEIILAGGIESMSNSPHTVKGVRRFRKMGDVPLKDYADYLGKQPGGTENSMLVDEMINGGLWDCYSDLHMGSLAEKIGKKYKISREEQDKFALDSHRKAAAAADSGKFRDEIIKIDAGNGAAVDSDEGIRRDTDMQKLGALKPAFGPDGSVTAGNAAQISDGASFLLLASGKAVSSLGLKPLAKIECFAASGIDPSWYGLAPTTAVNKLLEKSGHTMDEIDLVEINEAFCVQVLGVVKELGIDMSRLNVNGGATALGHPIGASGARILTTLVYALRDRGKKLGLAALCHGGGGAFSMIVSRD